MPSKTTKVPVALEIPFNGGPKDGETLRIVNPPPKRITIMFPSRGVYEYKKNEYHLVDED